MLWPGRDHEGAGGRREQEEGRGDYDEQEEAEGLGGRESRRHDEGCWAAFRCVWVGVGVESGFWSSKNKE